MLPNLHPDPAFSSTAYALSLFLGTFVLEDVAAIGGGLLVATGAISWPLAFTACFLGIWAGDAGLYALARCGGRRWFEKSRLSKYSSRVTQSEQWFERRGTAILIFSRMVPGARLPTYLAAGFLRIPWRPFLIVTGSASFVWTLIVLWLSQSAGARVFGWLGAYKQLAVALLAVTLFSWLTVRTLAALRPRFAAKFARLRHWEFWPAWLFYPPVALYYAWLAIKYRSATLPTAANPGIFSGGLVGESKMATLLDLAATSPEFTAEAVLVAEETFVERLRSLNQARARLRLDYPFMLKPDVGQRGVGVKLIRSAEQAMALLQATSAPLVAQRYAPGPHEAGVFYYRFPDESRGHIFAITEKIFPCITGDGRRTITELIHADARARLIANTYLRRFRERKDDVLAPGEELKLVEAGNHAQGCIFRDGARLATPELEARIDEISQKLSGFFVGRYDVRYASEDDLKAGRNFQVVELNGAASEATNIYDARNSLCQAYRTLFHQWRIVFAIAAANRQRGHQPTPALALWQAWRGFSRMAATYPSAD